MEQKNLLEASLQEATAAKEEISKVLEQERSAAAQTRQELAAEQERAAKMAANNLRLEQEKTEAESDLSRVVEHTGKLEVRLEKREQQVTTKEEEIEKRELEVAIEEKILYETEQEAFSKLKVIDKRGKLLTGDEGKPSKTKILNVNFFQKGGGVDPKVQIVVNEYLTD